MEDLPRYEAPNPYNYTKKELATRDIAIKAMIRDYPTVQPKWCEYLYDTITHMDEDEVAKIINDGLWEKLGKFSTPTGGVFKTGEVLDRPE